MATKTESFIVTVDWPEDEVIGPLDSLIRLRFLIEAGFAEWGWEETPIAVERAEES